MRTSISELAKINNLELNNKHNSKGGELNSYLEKAHKSDSAILKFKLAEAGELVFWLAARKI